MPWPPSSVPFDTASNRPNAGTTEPAGSTSIFSSPPVMSLIFLAKSSAISWKMSFEGQVLWNRKLVVVWAVDTIGAAIAVAAPTVVAALLRKRRRVANARVRGVVLSVNFVSGSNTSGATGGPEQAGRAATADTGHRPDATQVGEAP